MVNGNLNKLPELTQYRSERMIFDLLPEGDQISSSVSITGHFDIKRQPTLKLKFELAFEVIDKSILRFSFSIPAIDNKYINTVRFAFNSDEDEEIYGMGIQNSVWNFKGHSVPLLSAEGGVGRGLEPISSSKGIDAGTSTTSYGPALSFITNKQRAFVCESTNLGLANFSTN